MLGWDWATVFAALTFFSVVGGWFYHFVFRAGMSSEWARNVSKTLGNIETEIGKTEERLTKSINGVEIKVDAMDGRLRDVEKSVAKIDGKLEGMTMNVEHRHYLEPPPKESS